MRERFIVDRKIWDRFSPGVQIKLLQTKEVIFEKDSKPELKGKKKLIHYLNQIDFTTKDGQKNFDKYIGGFERYMKKFDEKMDEFDKAFEKFDESFKKLPGGKTKTALDDPFGKGDIDGVVK